MLNQNSPLRYPGGKAKLFSRFVNILELNKMRGIAYAEPYAGGGGLALSLLYRGYVSHIHLNDLDPAIWAFWHSILNNTSAFTKKINDTPVTVDQWCIQREIYKRKSLKNVLDLGFATFFLNRTNRSGIIKNGGVIGGFEQQGKYKIDCRFNKKNLIQRVEKVRSYGDRIQLSRLDALDFLGLYKNKPAKQFFLYIDPPYFVKGKKLYTNFYTKNDHKNVARAALDLGCSWVMTYDNTPEIKNLYKDRRQFEFNLHYSAQLKRNSTEIMIASKGLWVPPDLKERQVNKPGRKKHLLLT